MKTLLLFMALVFVPASYAAGFEPQVVRTEVPAVTDAAKPAAASAVTDAASVAPVPAAPSVMKSPAQNNQLNSGKQMNPMDENPLAQMQQLFTNGAGPTGTNWDSGAPEGSSGSTGATPGTFDMNGSGQCGNSQDLWNAARVVMEESVIPTGKGYNIGAPNWPKLTGRLPNSLSCDFGPQKQSMCTSATAAAICQHFANLSNSGKISLTRAQLEFLNGPSVKAAINGNTFSVAYLFQNLGGSSIYGKGDDISKVLKQAKTGDVLRLDRKSRTGHSTIFKEIKGDKFCYWTSNKGTNGVGVQCENISALDQVVVSRFPSNLSALPARLNQMSTSKGDLTQAKANRMSKAQIHWTKDNKLEDCLPSNDSSPSPAAAAALANR